MPNQVLEPTVHAEFHGDVSGQVAIGNNNLQINQMYGGVVYHLAGGQTAVPRPVHTPVYLRPRRFPGLLDRQVERQTAQATTQKALPVQFYSDSGWGKTSLLRYLAYHLDDSLYPDGIVYQRVAGMGLDDIRQVLFDLFYEADIPIKPLPGQITRYLQQKQALVLLDDIALPREDMEELMDTAPRCTFLFASPENTIWHEGKAIQVKGLPEEEALQLLEDELSRPLSTEEAQAACIIVGVIQGNPLKLRQLAALMQDKDLSLARIAAGLTTPENATALDDQKLTAFAVRSLPEDQRQVALGMAAAGGAPLTQPQIAAISEAQDVSQALVELEKRGLVSQQSGQFRLLGKAAKVINEIVDLTPLKERALDYLIQVAEREATEMVTAVAEAMQNLAQWAVETNRATEAVKLVRAADNHLILSKRWDLWREMLAYGREAAQLAADPSNEAWAWHQIGTRAQCLGLKEVAKPALLKALRLRDRLGESEAAAVTRHNLDLLLGPGGDGSDNHENGPDSGPSEGSGGLTGGGGSGILLQAAQLAAIIVMSVMIGGGIFLLTAELPPATPTPQIVVAAPVDTAVPPPQETPTATATATTTSTATSTATATHTPTPTWTPLPACRPYQPPGWQPYLVQYGDTFYGLAALTGTTVEMIMQVNCLDNLYAGSSIWLPPLPPTLTPTPSITPSPPDLIISGLTAVVSSGGEPVVTINEEGTSPELTPFTVPVTINVYNQGGEAASGFRIVVCYALEEYYSGAGGPKAALQEVSPCAEFFVEGSVPPQTAVTYNTTFTFPGSWHGSTVNIAAEADSCYGEHRTAPCRVAESNEENNQAVTAIVLPAYDIVTAEPPTAEPPTEEPPTEEPPTEVPNTPPTVQIVVPEGGVGSYFGYDGVIEYESGVVYYSYVSLQAYAVDEEDGELSGSSIVWQTNRADIPYQRSELGYGGVISAELYAIACYEEPHTITVTVTDSGGLRVTDTATIYLNPGCGGG